MSLTRSSSAADGADARRRTLAAWVASGVLVALYATAIGTVRASLPDAEPAMPAVGADAPPLDLGTLSGPVAAHYRFAADHEAAYATIPCYCGCDEFIGHRSLFDCFVRADGAGWDAHGAGCAICQAEATTARRLLERGATPEAVRAEIVATFGPAPDRTSGS